MTDKNGNKNKYTKPYEELGRFIMGEVYNILLNAKDYKIEYKELKRHIQEKIDNNPQIDKEFAMYELQHGSSKSYLCTYRWESVLYYYLMQHHKASFTHFEYWENKNGVHDYIALRDDYLLNPECRYFEKFRKLRETGKFTIEKPGEDAIFHLTSRYVQKFRTLMKTNKFKIAKTNEKVIKSMFDWAQYLNKRIEDYYLYLIVAYSDLHKDATFDKFASEICGSDFQQLTPEGLKHKAEHYLHEESILADRKHIKTRGGN